jgi:hypothetical protein
MTEPTSEDVRKRRANIRLAVILGLVAVGFYVTMFAVLV